MSDAGKPLTTGWKIAILLAIVLALGNSGVGALREQEERRFRNHENRLDELERKLHKLESILDETKHKTPEKGG